MLSLWTISIGKRADLILLELNPLENIDNMTTQLGVMLQGRWFSQKRLEKILQGIRDHYRVSIV